MSPSCLKEKSSCPQTNTPVPFKFTCSAQDKKIPEANSVASGIERKPKGPSAV